MAAQQLDRLRPVVAACVNDSAPTWVGRESVSYWIATGLAASTLREATRKSLS